MGAGKGRVGVVGIGRIGNLVGISGKLFQAGWQVGGRGEEGGGGGKQLAAAAHLFHSIQRDDDTR